ncbi:hypothetical protein C7M84_022306 [Penaeus vannamei]|uniref:Uncharacterized protein n=1 Tax=Penaeus vannamei TaxID=6689 RepID=A0A3R7T0S7_PENVA|nr:hypothetical protein C7M84_022306 [Penaeus vannamei]
MEEDIVAPRAVIERFFLALKSLFFFSPLSLPPPPLLHSPPFSLSFPPLLPSPLSSSSSSLSPFFLALKSLFLAPQSLLILPCALSSAGFDPLFLGWILFLPSCFFSWPIPQRGVIYISMLLIFSSPPLFLLSLSSLSFSSFSFSFFVFLLFLSFSFYSLLVFSVSLLLLVSLSCFFPPFCLLFLSSCLFLLLYLFQFSLTLSPFYLISHSPLPTCCVSPAISPTRSLFSYLSVLVFFRFLPLFLPPPPSLSFSHTPSLSPSSPPSPFLSFHSLPPSPSTFSFSSFPCLLPLPPLPFFSANLSTPTPLPFLHFSFYPTPLPSLVLLFFLLSPPSCHSPLLYPTHSPLSITPHSPPSRPHPHSLLLPPLYPPRPLSALLSLHSPALHPHFPLPLSPSPTPTPSLHPPTPLSHPHPQPPSSPPSQLPLLHPHSHSLSLHPPPHPLPLHPPTSRPLSIPTHPLHSPPPTPLSQFIIIQVLQPSTQGGFAKEGPKGGWALVALQHL